MRRLVATLILIVAVNAYAGGPSCAKVIIDSYGALGAEAQAMYEGQWYPLLTQESAALYVTSKAFCDGFMELYPAIQYSEAHLKAGLALAYAECDWAKEMRQWRDAYNANEVTPDTARQHALRLRKWRDQLTKWMQDTSELYFSAEYKPKADN